MDGELGQMEPVRKESHGWLKSQQSQVKEGEKNKQPRP